MSNDSSHFSCSKSYEDFPCSHRQWQHKGHCRYIHGYSRAFTFWFKAKDLDHNGFVVDFGKLDYLSEWIDKNLDHGCLICKSDPKIDHLRNLAELGLLKILEIQQASCEGIAKYLFSRFDQLVRDNTNNRAWIKRIHLKEDSKNSATFEPDQIR